MPIVVDFWQLKTVEWLFLVSNRTRFLCLKIFIWNSTTMQWKNFYRNSKIFLRKKKYHAGFCFKILIIKMPFKTRFNIFKRCVLFSNVQNKNSFNLACSIVHKKIKIKNSFYFYKFTFLFFFSKWLLFLQKFQL